MDWRRRGRVYRDLELSWYLIWYQDGRYDGFQSRKVGSEAEGLRLAREVGLEAVFRGVGSEERTIEV